MGAKQAFRQENDDEWALAEFFELSVDMLCIAGVDGYFKKVNSAFEQLGYTREELLSRPFVDFVHPEDVASTLWEVEKLSRGITTVNFENRYRRKDGVYRWLQWTTKPYGVGVLFAIARYVTDMKDTEEKLARAVRERDDMIGVISHELKNPLTALDTSAQLIRHLLEQGGRRERLLELVDRQMLSIHRMNRLISDLLDVTRLEAGALRLEFATHELADILKDVLDAQSLTARKRGVSLRGHVEPGYGLVRCDRGRTFQVLANLVDNAIRFSHPGGTVSILAGRGDRHAQIRVVDHGKGIASGDLPHVFNRFWQAKATAQQGAGLGLPIARSLVEAQGGTIWVESRPGQGATFHFTLPLAEPRRAEGAA
jgi:PAS domain S-box-containing protein